MLNKSRRMAARLDSSSMLSKRLAAARLDSSLSGPPRWEYHAASRWPHALDRRRAHLSQPRETLMSREMVMESTTAIATRRDAGHAYDTGRGGCHTTN